MTAPIDRGAGEGAEPRRDPAAHDEAAAAKRPRERAAARPAARTGDWARLRRDFDRLRRVKGRGLLASLVDAFLLDSGFQALVAHRLAHALVRRGVPLLPAVCRRWAIGACGVDILPRADVGGGCIVAHGLGLVIGGYTVIGEDATLLHGVTLGEVRFDEIDYPRLGDRVTVGAGAAVLGGITVGDDATIGAGAVVLADVPAGARVAGVPARIVGRTATGDQTTTTDDDDTTRGAP